MRRNQRLPDYMPILNDRMARGDYLPHYEEREITEPVDLCDAHGYLNPATDRYAGEIADAVTDLSFWTTEQTQGFYGSPLATFEEYMNWGLVGLRYVDEAPGEDHEKLLNRLDKFMGVDGRGFLQFSEFSAFLVETYTNRGEGETIADLYPLIVQWFAAHEAQEKR